MKPEWGAKHECPACGAHFYDMRKPDACCPKCQTPMDDEAALLAKTAEVDDVPEVDEEDDVMLALEEIDEDVDMDDDDDFMEDADDLGGDDDMSEIMDHMEEEREEANL
jgi:hypothetical protein